MAAAPGIDLVWLAVSLKRAKDVGIFRLGLNCILQTSANADNNQGQEMKPGAPSGNESYTSTVSGVRNAKIQSIPSADKNEAVKETVKKTAEKTIRKR